MRHNGDPHKGIWELWGGSAAGGMPSPVYIKAVMGSFCIQCARFIEELKAISTTSLLWCLSAWTQPRAPQMMLSYGLFPSHFPSLHGPNPFLFSCTWTSARASLTMLATLGCIACSHSCPFGYGERISASLPNINRNYCVEHLFWHYFKNDIVWMPCFLWGKDDVLRYLV